MGGRSCGRSSLGAHTIASEACDACCENKVNMLAHKDYLGTATFRKGLAACSCCKEYGEALELTKTEYYPANSDLFKTPQAVIEGKVQLREIVKSIARM